MPVSHFVGHWHLVAATQMAPSVPMATKVARAPHIEAPMAISKFGNYISKFGTCRAVPCYDMHNPILGAVINFKLATPMHFSQYKPHETCGHIM